MSNEVEQRRPESVFRHTVQTIAESELQTMLGDEAGRKAAAKFALAFRAAATKTPALYNCSQQSVGTALAYCLIADLTPSGHHPQVWLIPKGGGLQCWIAPHGYRELARRARVFLCEIPIWKGQEDDAREAARAAATGGVFIPPVFAGRKTLDDLAGFYVVIKATEGTRVEFLSGDEILERRKVAGSRNIWDRWPIEMARKTALRWAFARGFVPMGKGVQEAVDADIRADIVDEPPPSVAEKREAAADALMLPDEDDVADAEWVDDE